ncbi:MAG: UDP-N-acetylmuramoyl-L-alanyl-D-glutamate--2,6-diaminopimelate ligase [Candidatus Saccharibacteria bacterium]
MREVIKVILEEILKGQEYQVVQGAVNVPISGIEYDSRRVQKGSLFVCIPGSKTDGHLFVPEAVKRGAAALLVEQDVEVPAECTVVKVPDTHKILPAISGTFYEHPSKGLRVIGVTGTNGKTTTTHLIKAILEEAGHKVGLIGTLYASWQGETEHLANTTPESLDIERFMRRVKNEGGGYVVMEVSSHALDMGRVKEIDFDVAVFTNLTQDHLDYHKTLENYRNAKGILFSELAEEKGSFAVINTDDMAGDYFIDVTKSAKTTYGISEKAEIRAIDPQVTASGSAFDVVYPGGKMCIKLKLAGMFNVYNALAGIGFALKEGIAPSKIKKALEKVNGVSGRFESVNEGQEFTVIVDYAHTPDGLENVLRTARQIVESRLITVFGCGGDRDRKKRPIMGEIAARLSDFSFVTSDNPRSEEPMAIIDEILVGMKDVEGAHYAVIPDRRDAIHHAIKMAAKGDMVVIAGKGHEDYQIIKGVTYPFDDRVVAREFLGEMMGSERKS